ncbi:MAG: NUDIX hydrolase [Muribaculaceae bacterium]|nr:NUDIX hydrolase [Muribaculaceae bacterium]MDE6346589.1 NUDIX hydrolase [Muribaculaceae bacterium]
MEKWKVIDTEYLIRRPWLTARRDSVQLPDGKILDEYYVLEYPTWVNVIAVTTDRRFVMVEQYRHGLQDIFTELVAGVVEKGEAPLDAAKRELLEETGFGNGSWHLNSVLSANPSSMNNLTYSYIAEGVEPIDTQHLDDTEDINVKILSEEEVKQLLRDDKIKQSLMAAALLKYFSNI